MKFTKVRLNGLSIVDLPIVGALPSDHYILKTADGLGPPEVDVAIAETLNAGGVYQGRRSHNREIVLSIGLNPDFGSNQTAADLRTELYGMLTPGNTDYILVEIMNIDQALASTEGYVKKLEIVPFTQDPEVQLTLACTKQYFQTETDLYVDPGSLASPSINNVGTAQAGFHMEVNITGALSVWRIQDVNGKKMEIAYGFAAGDKLIIDTRPGLRGIWVVRASVTTNIIYALSWDSVWFMLHGGLNQFTTTFQTFTWGNVFYRPQYWGI